MRPLSQRLEIRLSEPDTDRLRQIAARAGRSESEVLRAVIRSIDPATVTTGIPLPMRADTQAETRREAALV